MIKTILQVKDLSVHAGGHTLVAGISFDVHPGEIVTMIGPSGSGKSTILRAINRLADLESGLKVDGHIQVGQRNVMDFPSVNDLRRDVGLVFQKPCIFPGSVYRNVLFGVRHHKRMNKSQKDDLVEAVLTKAHLWGEVKDRLLKPASILSAGQKQRLAFARTLAVNPSLILLDEPTANLDPESTGEIEKALLELKKTTALLLVTHHIEQARRCSDRIFFIAAVNGPGRIIEYGRAQDIFHQPRHAQTKRYFS